LTILSSFRSFNRPARLFLLTTVINGIIFSGWQLFFNFFILSRGFDKSYLGLVNSAPSVASLLLGLPLGILSDRIGRKRAMLIGLGVGTLCQAGTVLFTHPYLIVFTAFLAGAGNIFYFISQPPFMVKASTHENRTLLFSVNFGLTTLAGAVGNLFAGQLPGAFAQWLHVAQDSATAYQAVLIASVLLGATAVIPLLMVKEPAEPEPAAGQTEPRRITQVLFRPMVMKLFVPNVLIGIGAAILIPYMNVYFSERFGVTDQNLGYLFSMSALLTGIGSIVGPRLAARWGGKIRTIVITQSASLLFLILLGFSPLPLLAEIGFLARGVLMNLAAPLYSTFSMEQTKASEQGTVNSFLSVSWQAGWSVGPFISGIVQERWGFNPLFITTTLLYAMAIGLTWIFFHKHEQIQADMPRVALSGGVK
jgi:MFS family permease